VSSVVSKYLAFESASPYNDWRMIISRLLQNTTDDGCGLRDAECWQGLEGRPKLGPPYSAKTENGARVISGTRRS
jgi:hypothetical protein